MKPTDKRGFEILRDKTLYRSIAFTREQRERLGLRGLLPYAVSSQDDLVRRVPAAFTFPTLARSALHDLPGPAQGLSFSPIME